MTVLDVAGRNGAAGISAAAPSGGASPALNLADLAVDRHVRDGDGTDVALRWIGSDPADLDDPLDITFAKLARQSDRFASALEHHGIAPGTVVSTLLGRVPDLYVAALGAWKARCVFAALPASSDPRPVADRLRLAQAGVVITTPRRFRRVLSPVLDLLPDLRLVLVCGASEDQTARSTTRPGDGPAVMSCGAFLRDGVDAFDIGATGSDTAATLHFTDEPADTPRVVVRPHHVADVGNGHGLDLRGRDVYLRTTDPVWVTGTGDDVTAALAAGATSIVDEADGDAERTLRLLERQRVDVLATSASELRALRVAAADREPLPRPLRVVEAVGEPLDPATAAWAASFLGTAVCEVGSATAAPRSAKM